MHVHEIPRWLFDEFKTGPEANIPHVGSAKRLIAPIRISEFPHAEISWYEHYPGTHVEIFNEGFEIARGTGASAILKIAWGTHNSLWITLPLDFLEVKPYKTIITKCKQLYKQNKPGE
jgi:hypothetical protein